jgi:hypothetical protein
MLKSVWAAGAFLPLALSACGAPARASKGVPGAEPVPEQEAQPDLAGYAVAESLGGMFTAAWRPVEGAVPVNELFEIEVLLFEGRGCVVPLSGVGVQISAWMPDHMHGMSRRPEATEVAPGRYLVRGVLLHMEGFWQFFVDVIRDGVSERAEFTLTLA